MFVKRTKVSSGKRSYEYLSLVESFRDDAGRNRHRTIARLGEVTALAANGDLDRIIGALQRFAVIETSTDTTTSTDPVGLAAEEAPAEAAAEAATDGNGADPDGGAGAQEAEGTADGAEKS